MSAPYKYFAFISYSRKDSKAAAWLQKRLEWFRFPVKLVPAERRPPDERYVRPVYRDKTHLEVTDEYYWKNIRLALEESRYLIVLASPNSAQSTPVNMEVNHFLICHEYQSSLVVPVILSGRIAGSGDEAAFCPALRNLGESLTSRNLPSLVTDFDMAELDAWEQGFVALVSYLLRLDRTVVGDHLQRETRRQARGLKRWLVAVCALTLMVVAGAWYGWKQAVKARAASAIAQIESRKAVIAKSDAEHQAELATASAKEAEHQRELVTKEKEKQDQTLWAVSGADHGEADLLLKSWNYPRSLAYFSRALRSQPKNTAAMTAAAFNALAPSGPSWIPRTLCVLDGSISALDSSTSGEWLAAGTQSGNVSLLHSSTGKVKQHMELKWPVLWLRFDDTGGILQVAITSQDQTSSELVSIELKSWKASTKHRFEGCITGIDMDSAQKILAVGLTKGLMVMDLHSGEEIYQRKSIFPLDSIAISPDGSCLVAGGDDQGYQGRGEYFSIDIKNKMPLWEKKRELRYAKYGADGQTVIMFVGNIEYTESGFKQVSDTEQIKSINPINHSDIFTRNFSHAVKSISLSPSLEYAAICTTSRSSGTLHVIATDNGETIFESPINNSTTMVDFSRDGRWLTLGFGDGKIAIMEASPGHDLTPLPIDPPSPQPKQEFTDIPAHLSPDGHMRTVIDGDGASKTVKLFKRNGGELLWETAADMESTICEFSPDSRYLIVGDGSGWGDAVPLRIFDTQKAEQVIDDPKEYPITALNFSSDGSLLALGFGDPPLLNREMSHFGEVMVIALPSLKQLYDIVFETQVADLKLSGDGRWLYVSTKGEAGYSGSEFNVFEALTGARAWHVACKDCLDKLVLQQGGVRIGEYNRGGKNKRDFYFDSRWLCPASEVADVPFLALIARNSGMEPIYSGGFRFSTSSEVQRLQESVLLGQQTESGRNNIWQTALLKWSLFLPEVRPISPWANQTIREKIGEQLMNCERESIRAYAAQAPWHPLVPVSLARLQPKLTEKTDEVKVKATAARSSFLAHQTLSRLKSADESLYGGTVLAEYAAWSAKIMHHELHLNDASGKALLFALEQLPADRWSADVVLQSALKDISIVGDIQITVIGPAKIAPSLIASYFPFKKGGVFADEDIESFVEALESEHPVEVLEVSKEEKSSKKEWIIRVKIATTARKK